LFVDTLCFVCPVRACRYVCVCVRVCMCICVYNHSAFPIRERSDRITGLDSALGFQEVEAPRISRQSSHEGCNVVSPTHRPPLPPRRYSWYSFLLEAESTPGPQCGPKDYVNEKSHSPRRESNPRPIREYAAYNCPWEETIIFSFNTCMF
jgi:hypothetical protein